MENHSLKMQHVLLTVSIKGISISSKGIFIMYGMCVWGNTHFYVYDKIWMGYTETENWCKNKNNEKQILEQIIHQSNNSYTFKFITIVIWSIY